MPLQIAGYNTLPLSLPPLPSFPRSATHYLYLAEHQPRIPTPTASRSIFLVNVPFDATVPHLKHLFSNQLGLPAGRVGDIEFEGQRKSTKVYGETPGKSKLGEQGLKRKRSSDRNFSQEMEDAALPSTWDRDLQTNGLTAVVKFVDRASMDAALRAVKAIRKQQKDPVWGEGMDGKVPAFGLSSEPPNISAVMYLCLYNPGYLSHHQLVYPEKTQLLASVNAYMTAFAAKEAAEARLQTKQRQEPDADGFITVTRGGRVNPPRQEAAQEQAAKQKDKHKGRDDFYRFQSREKRKERAGELVKKFEEDREKVKKMKERRGRFRVSVSKHVWTPVIDTSFHAARMTLVIDSGFVKRSTVLFRFKSRKPLRHQFKPRQFPP